MGLWNRRYHNQAGAGKYQHHAPHAVPGCCPSLAVLPGKGGEGRTLHGRNNHEGPYALYRGDWIDREVTLGNYYMEYYFGEKKLTKIVIPLCIIFLIVMFAGVVIAGGAPRMNLLYAVVFILVAPFAGGLIVGLDRKISARMQGRVGPPVLQPFYDVGKLFEKEKVVVDSSQNVYVLCYLVFIALSGAFFFAGEDLLLIIFAFTLAHVFLILGVYASNSPYSHIGAERE